MKPRPITCGLFAFALHASQALSQNAPALVEAHVTTPLNHRDMNGPIIAPDAVVMTTGIHLGLFRNATLSFGAARTVTGSLPYSIEGFVQFNLRF